MPGAVANWTVSETAGSLADQNQLTVIGGAGPNSFTVTAGEIFLGTQGFSYSGIQILKILGGPGNDSLTVDGSSASTVILDGAAGSDMYTVTGTGSFDVWVSDSGPGPAQGDTDTLRVPANSVSETAVGGFFRLVSGGTTIYYDTSIEKVEQNAVSPILTVQGTGGNDTFTVNGSVLTFNSFVIDLTSVTQLTIDENGGNDTITVLGVLPTLTSFVINGGSGTTTLVGPNDPTAWTITGQNAGSVGVGNSQGGTLTVSFTNVRESERRRGVQYVRVCRRLRGHHRKPGRRGRAERGELVRQVNGGHRGSRFGHGDGRGRTSHGRPDIHRGRRKREHVHWP